MAGYSFGNGLTLDPGAEIQAGIDKGKQTALSRLLGQAYGAQGDDRQGLLQQAAMIDPTQTMKAQQGFRAQDDDALASFTKKAVMAAQAWQSGDKQMAQGIYSSLLPEASSLFPGFQPPPQMDDATAQHFAKLAGGKEAQGFTLSPGSAHYDASGKLVVSQPFAPEKPQNASFQVDKQGRGWWLRPGEAPMPADMPGGQQPSAQPYPNANLPVTGSLDVTKDYPQLASAYGATPTSLYRTPDHNAAVGGVPNSQHLRGTAGDFVVPPAQKAAFIADARRRGYQPIDEGDHVHLQLPRGAQAASTFAPGQGIQFKTAGGSDALQQKIDVARQYGATPAEIKAMVLGRGGQDGATPEVPGDQTKTGDAYLATLPPQAAAQVKALADGRMAFPTGTALKSPYWQGMLSAVSQYDPQFDAVNYNARAKTRSDFTSGKSANNIKALNTLAGHVAELQHAVNSLGGTDYPLVNSVRNAALSATGDTRLSTLNAAKTAVANELTTVFRGSGGAEADVQGWLKQLDEAKSPGQLNASIRQIGALVESRIQALQEQYTQGMGTTRAGRAFVTPANQRFFDDLLGHQSAPAAPQGGGWSITKVGD